VRSNTARAAELIAAAINCVSGSNASEVEQVFHEFRLRPEGGSYRHKTGSTLVWGDISRLVAFLPEVRDVSLKDLAGQYLVPSSGTKRFIIHIDSVKSGASEALGLPTDIQGLLGHSLGKADLLLVGEKSILKLSVKQLDSKEVKLGQQSASAVYDFRPVNFTLSGGKNFPNLKHAVAELTSRLNGKLIRPNALSSDQWDKIAKTPEQQRLAVVKSSWPEEWSAIVSSTLYDAGQALDAFLNAAFSSNQRDHAPNLSEILRHRLLGRTTGAGQSWITSKTGPYRLDETINNLSAISGLRAEWSRRASGMGKDSWLIYVTLSKKRYLVTKIEPSFDGHEANVSQTKGVIYYFQEGSGARTAAEGSVWDLLSDVSVSRQ
jgi:hypothetical protein